MPAINELKTIIITIVIITIINRFYKFARLRLFNFKHKFVHLQLLHIKFLKMMNTILSNKKTPKKIKHKSKKFCYSDQLMKYEYKIKKIWEIK